MINELSEELDDLDTMIDPEGMLENGEIDAAEEGFIKGFIKAGEC